MFGVLIVVGLFCGDYVDSCFVCIFVVISLCWGWAQLKLRVCCLYYDQFVMW